MQHEILLNERSHLLKQEQRVVVSTHDAYLLICLFGSLCYMFVCYTLLFAVAQIEWHVSKENKKICST